MRTLILDGLRGILFPRICLSCGDGIPGSEQLICPFCASSKFEDPNPDRYSSPPGIILPEFVHFLDSMWQFDTSGGLRDMLHALKYDGLISLGHELGALLFEKVFVNRYEYLEWMTDTTVLLPVPMHAARQRARGYNQATEIARGFSFRSGIAMLGEKSIVRVRRTKSQTGFSQTKRVQNIHGAFSVNDSACIQNRKVIIIDDVYTTGATTFELASTLHRAGSGAIGILTVAAT
jgi:ComF family protein